MTFDELARARYSVRAFDPRPIEEEKLTRILGVGNVAPTGCNKQPQRIYVIQSATALETVRKVTSCHFNAPVVLLFAYDRTDDWQNPLEAGVHAGVQDVSIVATHIMLAAWEQGIGSCWVNYFSPTEAARAFGLPEKEIPVLLMPLGYPAANAQPAAFHAQKKPLSETVQKL